MAKFEIVLGVKPFNMEVIAESYKVGEDFVSFVNGDNRVASVATGVIVSITEVNA